MCNSYEQVVAYREYVEAMRQLELPTPEGESAADLPQNPDIHIGDMGTVARTAGNGVELVQMRFGFPPPRAKAGPVFNFKSEGRHFADSRRGLVILPAFSNSRAPSTPRLSTAFRWRMPRRWQSPHFGATATCRVSPC